MIRRLALIPVLAALWAALLAWAAGVPWNAPLTPRMHLGFRGGDFHAQIGEGTVGADGLSVAALADGTALQSVTLNRVRAEDFPVLRYRIADFPDTLELSLIFRRADKPEDIGTISIPSPGRGEVAIDLSSLPDWRGEITELGFAEYAAAQLVPPSAATFRPFRIEGAQLQSAAWDQVVPRLASDWFGYRPWALYSISALGPQIAALSPSWMQPVLAFGAVFSLFAAWAILGWTRRRAAQGALFLAIGAWLLADARWLDDFTAKHRTTEGLYAGKPWDVRAEIQPDEATFAAARDVSRIAAEQGARRVLVLSDSTYTFLRFIYFLLPMNAVPMSQAVEQAPNAPLPGDALIAAFESGWKYDEATGRLSNGASSYSAVPVYSRGDLRVFRAREAAP